MTEPTHRRACISCKDERWLSGAVIAGKPTVRPCPECNPAGHALIEAGAWSPDAATRRDDTRWDNIAGKAGSSRRTALVPTDYPDAERIEYLQQLVRASRTVGTAKAARWRYMVRLADQVRITLPCCPIGDEEALAHALDLLAQAGAPIDWAAVRIPTPEEVLAGARILPMPGEGRPAHHPL